MGAIRQQAPRGTHTEHVHTSTRIARSTVVHTSSRIQATPHSAHNSSTTINPVETDHEVPDRRPRHPAQARVWRRVVAASGRRGRDGAPRRRGLPPGRPLARAGVGPTPRRSAAALQVRRRPCAAGRRRRRRVKPPTPARCRRSLPARASTAARHRRACPRAARACTRRARGRVACEAASGAARWRRHRGQVAPGPHSPHQRDGVGGM